MVKHPFVVYIKICGGTMSNKKSDGKLYRIYNDQDSHLNRKINENGRKAAIQFRNVDNKLSGPLEIEEVDIEEIIGITEPKDMNPYVRLVLEDIIAPSIQYAFEIGIDKLLCYLSDKGIPSAKQTIKEFYRSKKMYIEGIRDGLTGKEPKACQLLQEAEKRNCEINTKVGNNSENIFEKEIHSIEEVQHILDTLKKSVLLTAGCIRYLTNTVVYDNGTNPEVLEDCKQQLEAMLTNQVMSQIALMLEDRNRALLDENTFEILDAFRNGNFVVEGKMVPITRYIEYSVK